MGQILFTIMTPAEHVREVPKLKKGKETEVGSKFLNNPLLSLNVIGS